MKRVFVYGTLRRGFRAHRFLKDALFVGTTFTDANYTMYTSVHRDYPRVVTGGNRSIFGEVFEVSDTVLKELDAYEGVASGLYQRKSVKTDLGVAFMYVFNKPTQQFDIIEHGVWE